MAHTLDHPLGFGCPRKAPAPVSLGQLLSRGIGRAGNQIQLWNQQQRQRRDLAGLDAHLLADIGIKREAAEHEAAKPFWA